MPSGKREAARFRELSALAAAQPAEIRERRFAAEQTFGAIQNRLGMAGTYDFPQSSLPSAFAPPTGAPAAPGGGTGVAGGIDFASMSKKEKRQWIRQRSKELKAQGVPKAGQAAKLEAMTKREAGGFVTAKVTDAQGRKIDTRYSKLGAVQDVRKIDPEAYMSELEQSAQFRIASRLTAEAEQLINRQGPLWNEMVNFQQLPIMEGNAMMARENAENIRQAISRGGASRREAFAAVQQMRALERVNTNRVQQLTAHRVELDRWARENARTQLEWNQNWGRNLAGIQKAYNDSMDQASQLMATHSLPIMFAGAQEAAKWRHSAHAKNRNKVMRWVNGVTGVATMAVGGLAATGMLGSTASKVAGLFGASQTGIAGGGNIAGTGPGGVPLTQTPGLAPSTIASIDKFGQEYGPGLLKTGAGILGLGGGGGEGGGGGQTTGVHPYYRT